VKLINHIKSLFIITLINISTIQFLSAQDFLPKKTQDRIIDYLEFNEERYGIVGQSVAVLKNGKFIYSEAHGLASLELNVEATDKTVYMLFSISKLFVNVTIMQLVESGKIELDQTISHYLAGLPESWEKITVRQAMNHVTGLPEYYARPNITALPDYYEMPIYPTPKTASAALQSVVNKAFEFETGRTNRYNQTNFLLLKMVIEKITGKTYLSVAKSRMIDKLNLKNIQYGGEYDIIQGRARAYKSTPSGLKLNGPIDQPDYFIASASLNGNVIDMAKWLSALLNGQLISNKTMQQMWQPQLLTDGAASAFASGWEHSKRDGIIAVGHGGGGRVDVRHFYRENDAETVSVIYFANGGKKNYQPRNITKDIATIVEDGPQTKLLSLKQKMYKQLAKTNLKGALRRYQTFVSDKNTSNLSTERTINLLGYDVLYGIGANEAKPIFELNLDRYPNSANCHDSLAETYLILGEREKSRFHYSKAYQLEPSERVKNILADLQDN